MSENHPHRIEFPCDYPIKVIGETQQHSIEQIIEVVRCHAPEVTPERVSSKLSREGNYQSIRITIVATGEAQLKALHTDLTALPSVRMVL